MLILVLIYYNHVQVINNVHFDLLFVHLIDLFDYVIVHQNVELIIQLLEVHYVMYVLLIHVLVILV